MPAPVSVVRSTPTSNGLYDVLDLILDKGLVIDAYVRVSVVGIELITIDLRVVVASVDTYLRFAEAVDRLTLHQQGGAGLDDLVGGNGNGRQQATGGGGRRAVGSGDDSSVRDALGRVRDAVGGDDSPKSVVKQVRKAIAGLDEQEGDEDREDREDREDDRAE